MNHVAYGALLFGTCTLVFTGVIAILFGGPVEITGALLAMVFAYVAQLSFYFGEMSRSGAVLNIGLVSWAACALLVFLVNVLSLWS